jgi:hypothetical protein
MRAPRRNQVAELWAQGFTAQQIADRMHIADTRGVFYHLRKLRDAGDPRAHHRPQWANQRRNRAGLGITIELDRSTSSARLFGQSPDMDANPPEQGGQRHNGNGGKQIGHGGLHVPRWNQAPLNSRRQANG